MRQSPNRLFPILGWDQTLTVNRQHIFNQRVELVFRRPILRKLVVGDQMREPMDERPGANRGGVTDRFWRHGIDCVLQCLKASFGHRLQLWKAIHFELGTKHQQIDGGPRPGEGDIGDAQGAQAFKPFLAFRCPLHLRAKRLETLRRERRQQRLAAVEMPVGRVVGHACHPGHLSQTHLPRPTLFEQTRACREQGPAQVTMMIGCGRAFFDF